MHRAEFVLELVLDHLDFSGLARKLGGRADALDNRLREADVVHGASDETIRIEEARDASHAHVEEPVILVGDAEDVVGDAGKQGAAAALARLERCCARSRSVTSRTVTKYSSSPLGTMRASR